MRTAVSVHEVVLPTLLVMAINSHDKSSSNNSSTVFATINDDCYFYYYSSCTKGNLCPFRHEPAALRNETMCRFWLQGHCSKPNCIFRHMEISQPRDKVPCYFESQPGGCKKVHCAFWHDNILDQPREEDKAKNPDIILPLAGSQSPSDDDLSCNSLSQMSRSLFTPVQQPPSSSAAGYHRRSSTNFVRSRSSSRSPEFMMLPAPHPPVIVTTSDLESENDCGDSPQKSWMPRPLFTEVYQDPVRTKEREEELNMLHKVQEEQAEIIGYIFERGNEEEELIALANGGHGNQGIPNFVDEIEEFDVEDEEVESILPGSCSSSSEIRAHNDSNSSLNVSHIATVIGNRTDSNVIIRPAPVKAEPAPPCLNDLHNRRKTISSSLGSHHRHHVTSTSSPGSHHHHTETSAISSSHRQRSSPTLAPHSVSSTTSSSWSSNADSSRHLPSQAGGGGRNCTETADVVRPVSGSRRLRKGGLAGAILADALGTSNFASKHHGSSKRTTDNRDQSVQPFDHKDRHSRNGSSYNHHREAGFKDVHNRSSDRDDKYSASARRDSPSDKTYSSRKRSLPIDFTPEREAKKRVGSDFHRPSDHHLNNFTNGIDKSSSIKSGISSTSRHVCELRDDRSNRKISLHERFTISDGSDLPEDCVINSPVDDSRPARYSSLNTRDREHFRNREDLFSRTVRTHVGFHNSSSRDRSRSKSPEKRTHPVVEIKIKSLSEIRQERATKFAALTNESLKTKCRKSSGLKRKRSPVPCDESEDKSSSISRNISIKRARLDPEALPFVPSVHRRNVDVTGTKSSRGSHDSTSQAHSKVPVDGKSRRGVSSSSHKPDRTVAPLEQSSSSTLPSSLSDRAPASNMLGEISASLKHEEEEEEELLLTQYDEVDYEIDDIDEMSLLL